MKFLHLLFLATAAGVLGWIALRAPERSYVPHRLEGEPAPSVVPVALTGPIPAGHVAYAFEVEGMCCTGCTKKLHDALMAVDGVAAAAVSFRAGRVEPLAPAGFDLQILAASLNFDKYRAVPLPAE